MTMAPQWHTCRLAARPSRAGSSPSGNATALERKCWQDSGLGELVVTVGAYQVRLASLSGGDFAGGHAH